MFRKTLNISIVLVLLFASLVPAQPALAQESHPSIVANVTGDWVEVWGLGPDDLTARLEVIRGEGSDIVCSQDYSPVSGNPWLDCPDSGIQAEDLILLIVNEIEVKSHIVLDFTLDEFDPAEGYFAGTGPSGKSVWVSVCNPDLPCFDGMEIVNTEGFWEVSFGPDTVSPDAGFWATIWEEDGDSTQAAFIPPPTIEVNHTTNWLSASGFQPDESTADLEVYAPGEAFPKCSADYVLEGVFSVELNCWTTNVQPGDQIILKVDGQEVNDLIVKPITITEYDPNIGIIRGTAPVSAYVQADICNAEGFCYSGEATKLGDGNWEMSFDPLPFNYVGWVGAHVIESDGDHSIAEYIHRVTDVNVTGDWVSAWGFGPDDLFASLVVNRGEGSDPICGGDFDLSEGDPWLECWQQGVDIFPEDEVLLFVDGVEIKDHIVIDLTLDVVILEEGHFAGTAPEYSTVQVNVCNSEEDCYSGEYPLGENEETWQISFGQNLLSPDAWYGVYISDVDGDSTYADYVPPPVLDVNVSGDWVSAWGFGPDDQSARLEIYEQGDPYLKCAGDFDLSEGDPWLDCWEATILPGDLVVLKVDGEPVKDHIVFDLTLDIVDIEGGYFEGTAPEWSTVRVDVCNPPFEECSSLEYDTEDSTVWVISFGSGAVDPDAWFGAFMMDDDGDQTMAELFIPEPPPFPAFTVQPDHGWVCSGNWPIDVPVTLTIADDEGPLAEIIHQDTKNTVPAGWDPNVGEICFELYSMADQILPGMYVSLTDGVITKDTWILELGFDGIDPDTLIASGLGPEGGTGHVYLEMEDSSWFNRGVIIPPSGIWTADFSGEPLDLGSLVEAHIVIWDEDGDETMANLFDPPPPQSSIMAYPEFDTIDGTGFPLGEMVTLVIDDDLNPDNGNLYFDTGVVIEAPWSPDESWVSFYVGETFDLQPGHYVILFFEDIFQVHQVTNLTITNIDLDSKEITGTAEPFSGLFVMVNWAEETFVFTSADDNGNWLVDYTGIAALSHGDLVIAGQPDSENNTTLVNRIIVTPGGLIDEIINLPEEELAPEIKNSIIKKIENAHSSFLKGNTNAAIAKLEALLNQIEALRGNKISEETADHLNHLVWIMIRSFE